VLVDGYGLAVPRPDPTSRRRGRGRAGRLQRALAWASVGAIVTSALGLAALTAWRERSFEERRDEVLAERAGAALELVITSSIAALRGVEGLVGPDDRVGGDAFDRFAQAAATGSPLVTVGYQRLVAASERAAFEAETGLVVTRRSGTELVPADEHARYLPAEHVFPDEPAVERSRGFDMANDPDRRAAVSDTIDQGRTRISGPVALATTGRSGLIVTHPVAVDGVPVGMVSAALLTDELSDRVEALLPADVSVSVASEDGTLLDGPASGEEPGGATVAVDVAGMTLLVTADDPDEAGVAVPLGILAVGVVLAAGLLGFVWVSGRSQRAVEAAERRTEALLEVTGLLGRAVSTQEVATTLASSARRALGASGCVVAGVASDGTALRLLAVAGVPEERFEHVHGLPLDHGSALAEALRQRRTLWRDATRGWPDPELRSPFADPARAAIVIPLLADDQAVGVVGFAYEVGQLDGVQRSMAAALAEQAARAMARAWVYDREHEIAGALQRRLLPAALPAVTGLSVAGAYHAGAIGTVVGGDWYDAVVAGPDRLLVVVGDVVGSGPAAAAAMGQLRAAMEATFQQRHHPAEVVAGLDAFASHHADAFGSTCCVAEVAVDGSVSYVRAGHPPPLVIGPHGTRFLEEGGRPPLGVRGGADPLAAQAAPTVLGPDETLVLYTDGAVERRGEPLDVGLARLAELAQRRRREGVGQLCDGLLADLLALHAPTDDMAILAVRRSPIPDRGGR
jgi:serine phosphatase RsbU (regulator of sigma subunit)